MLSVERVSETVFVFIVVCAGSGGRLNDAWWGKGHYHLCADLLK